MGFKYKQQKKITRLNFLSLARTLSLQSDLLKLPPNYQIFPSQAFIVANNYKVKYLKIYNQFSSLQWSNYIDISNLKQNPLAQLIQLGKDYVEVYNNINLTPKQGIELNKPCVATFFNGSQLLNLAKNYGQLIQKLKNKCNQLNVQLVKFDKQRACWSIQIPHFTRYSFENTFDSNQSQQSNLSEFQEELEDSEKKIQIKKMDFNDTMIQEDAQLYLPISIISQESYTNRIQNSSQKLIEAISQHNLNLKKYNPKLKINFLTFGGSGYIYLLERSISGYQITSLPSVYFDHNFLNQFLSYNIKLTVNDSYIFDKLIEPRRDQFADILNLVHILFSQNVEINFLNKTKSYISGKESFDKEEVLKNWCEYIISTMNLQAQSQIKNLLCKRQIKTLYNNMVLQNNFKCAEIVTKLEDLLFRKFKKRNLHDLPIQLKWILDNQINNLYEGQQWFVQLANELWYNLEEDFQKIIQNKIEQYQKYPQLGKQTYSRVFRSFIYKYTNRSNMKFELIEFMNDKQQIIQWFISIILKQIQTEIYDKKFYTKFRINQVYSLISKIQSFDEKLKILKYDNFLSEDIKNKFRQDIFIREIQRIKIKADSISENDNILLNKALIIEKIYHFQSFDALELLIKDIQSKIYDKKYIENVAKDLIHIIKHGSYSEKTRFYQILKIIQTHTSDPTLMICQQYLAIWYNKIPLTIKILQDFLLKLEKSQIKIKKQIKHFLVTLVISKEDYFSQIFKQKANEKIYKEILQISKDYKDLHRRVKMLILPSL